MGITVDQNTGQVISDTTGTYQKCVLDGLAYWYNSRPSLNPVVTSMTKQQTLDGANFTIWLDPANNPIVADREITQTWDAMEQPFYKLLESKLKKCTPLGFVDEWGTPYTVLFHTLTWTSATAGGVIYQGVNALFWIISSP